MELQIQAALSRCPGVGWVRTNRHLALGSTRAPSPTHTAKEPKKFAKKDNLKDHVGVLGRAERGGRTRSLKIKSLTLYRLS